MPLAKAEGRTFKKDSFELLKCCLVLICLIIYFTPAFISDGCTSGGQRPVCGELYKQVASGAEHAFIGQILHLVGVIHRGRIYVVAILDQQSKKCTHTQTHKSHQIGSLVCTVAVETSFI